MISIIAIIKRLFGYQTKEYNEGLMAWTGGFTGRKCPYKYGTIKHSDWMKGYNRL